MTVSRPARSRTPCLAAILAVALLLAFPARGEEAGSAIEITTGQVLLNPENFDEKTVGRLSFRGGLSLRSKADGFGGFSALLVEPDRSSLTTVSDKGRWLRARIIYRDDGDLSGLADARMGPLLGPDGKSVVQSKLDDAEALAFRDGALIVAFERVHRLWVYPKGSAGIAGIPSLLPLPMGPGHPYPYEHNNGGIETLTELSDGRLLAITELFTRGSDEVRGWVRNAAGGGWQALYYRIHQQFRPTGATTLPSGDVLVLERQYHPIGLPAARIVRIAREKVVAEAVLEGEEIAELAPPRVIDNFEGIAARPDGEGGVFLYLISDDNFSHFQRTLLLMFHMAGR